MIRDTNLAIASSSLHLILLRGGLLLLFFSHKFLHQCQIHETGLLVYCVDQIVIILRLGQTECS